VEELLSREVEPFGCIEYGDILGDESLVLGEEL